MNKYSNFNLTERIEEAKRKRVIRTMKSLALDFVVSALAIAGIIGFSWLLYAVAGN